MKDQILIDSDVLIGVLRGHPEQVSEWTRIQNNAEPTISAFVEMEILTGVRNKPELRVVDSFLSHFVIIPFDQNISQAATDLLRRFVLSHGLTPGDAIIAATAIVFDLPFFTKNLRHYRFIPELRLLASIPA